MFPFADAESGLIEESFGQVSFSAVLTHFVIGSVIAQIEIDIKMQDFTFYQMAANIQLNVPLQCKY